MGKYVLMLVVLQLGLSSMVEAVESDSVPVMFGGVKIYPVLDINADYNSNVFQADTTDTQTGSMITTISPSLEIGIESGTTDVSVHFQVDKGVYKSASTADYTDQSATLRGSFGLTKRLTTNASFAYKKGHVLRGVTSNITGLQTFNTPDKLTITTLQGHATYGVRGRIEVDGKLVGKRYDDLTRGKFVDVDTMSGTLGLFVPIRSKGAAVFEVRYTDHNFVYNLNEWDNTEQGYFVGLDWDNKSTTSGALRLGYVLKTYAKKPNAGLFSWEADATWKPMSTSSLNFNTSYKPVESDGEYGYIVANTNQLSWAHEWSEFLNHTASVGYDFITYKSIGAEIGDFRHNEKLASVSFDMDYKVRRWLMIGGGYQFSNRTSDQSIRFGTVANPTFRQHILSFNMTATM